MHQRHGAVGRVAGPERREAVGNLDLIEGEAATSLIHPSLVSHQKALLPDVLVAHSDLPVSGLECAVRLRAEGVHDRVTVHPSGYPISLSHSVGVSRRTCWLVSPPAPICSSA